MSLGKAHTLLSKSPQCYPQNNVGVAKDVHAGYDSSAASFSHSFLQLISAVMFWSVFARKVPRAS